MENNPTKASGCYTQATLIPTCQVTLALRKEAEGQISPGVLFLTDTTTSAFITPSEATSLIYSYAFTSRYLIERRHQNTLSCLVVVLASVCENGRNADNASVVWTRCGSVLVGGALQRTTKKLRLLKIHLVLSYISLPFSSHRHFTAGQVTRKIWRF